MRRNNHFLAVLAVAAAGCANANTGDDDGMTDGGGGGSDAACSGDNCDADGDGVVDSNDQCPNTPPEIPVNSRGCSDSQVSPTLEPNFPPFGLTWTPTGDIGRPGGLRWTYSGINRGDLFHIYWVICDDPATPCGLSLNGPIDTANESWTYSTLSALGAGRLIFDSAPTILLADGTSPSLNARLVMGIIDLVNNPIPFATVSQLGVPPRTGMYGAQIPGNGFSVTAIIEVQDQMGTWVPYLDYYDAQSTPDGGSAAVSFAGSFYSE